MNHTRSLLALAIAGILHPAAWATETQSFTTEEILVQGNLLGDSDTEAVKTYAGHRSVIDKQQLHRGANRSLDDALQKVPGVKIQDETGTGVLPQIAVRGLNDSRSGRTQVLVDGTPLALAPYGQLGLSLFPVTMQTIDRIDVVRGGAAVQYGPNNVGGVINLISRPIPDAWENQLGLGSTFYDNSSHSLWDTYFRTGGAVSDDLALQLEGNYLKGEGGREHSATDVQNWLLRSRWDMTDNQTLHASVQRYDATAELPGALSKAAWEQDPRQSQRPHDAFAGDTWRGTLGYNLVLDRLGPFDWAELNWNHFLHHSDRSFEFGFNTAKGQSWDPSKPADVTRNSPRSFVTWGTEPRLTGYIAGNGLNQQWTLGTRFVKEGIDYQVNQTSLASGASVRQRDWRFDDKAVAAYVSDAIMLLDDRLIITPGLRLEDARMAYEDLASGTSHNNRSTEWLPGLTVGYQLTDSWFTYANGQRSLRPPQVTQIVKGGDVGAELAWNYESGVRFTPSQTLSLSLGLYRIDYADQIEYSAATDRFVNLGETRHQGVESELLWRPQTLPELALRGAYAYLDSEQRTGQYAGNQVPFSSRHQLVLGGDYDLHGYLLAVSGYYYSTAFSDAANTVDDNAVGSVGQQPSYWVWNTQLSKELLRVGQTRLEASLGVNNLFDEQYWFRGIDTSPWGRQPAPERTYTARFDYFF